MLTQGKIGPAEGICIASILLCLNALISAPIAADYGLQAGWIVLLITGGLSGLGVFILLRLMERFPEQTIIEISHDVLGPVPGFISGFMIFNFFLVAASLFLRIEADRINTVYLPLTPPAVLAITLLSIGLIGTFIGLESIGRAVHFLSIPLIASLILPLFLTFNFMDISNLFPLGGAGLKAIFKGGFLLSGLFAEILILTLIYPTIRPFKPIHLWGKPLLLGFSTNLISAIGVLLVFPVPNINENLFPIVQTARLIFLSRFLQRIDAFFAFFWITAIALKFTLLFYASCIALTRLLKLPFYRPLIFPLAVIVFALAFVPKDIIQVTNLITFGAWRWGGLIAYGLPALVLLIHTLRQKPHPKKPKRSTHNDKSIKDPLA